MSTNRRCQCGNSSICCEVKGLTRNRGRWYWKVKIPDKIKPFLLRVKVTLYFFISSAPQTPVITLRGIIRLYPSSTTLIRLTTHSLNSNSNTHVVDALPSTRVDAMHDRMTLPFKKQLLASILSTRIRSPFV
jgi:hypothetical protein